MTLIRVAAGVLFFASLSACGGSSVSVVPFDVLAITDRPEVMPRDEEFGSLLNGIRSADGILTVTYNEKLNAAAQGHADDMRRRGYFSHQSPEGLYVQHRIAETGYRARAYGENIGMGQQDNAQVLRHWQSSPEHNRLLMSDNVDEFGLGVAGRGGNTRWVLVMARD